MNCAEAKRLIAFTRKGEMGPAEEYQLAEHVRTCPACQAERAAFLNQDRAVEKLRSIVPTLKNPEANVQAILRRVREEVPPQRQGVVSALVDRLIGALEVPGLRYALAVFVTVMVTGFVIQQVTILRSVSALEARLAKPEAPRIRLAYAVTPGAVEHLTRSEEIRAMLEKAGANQELGSERLHATRAGSIADLLNSPESRWVLHTLLPGTRERGIDSLVNELSRNVRLVLTYSKGDGVR
jgi:anti-sigma factor RsiW